MSTPSTTGEVGEVQTEDTRQVLIVDDDEDFAESLADILESHGYPCGLSRDAESACSVSKDFAADVALVDVRLGSDNGVDLVSQLRQIRPDIPPRMQPSS